MHILCKVCGAKIDINGIRERFAICDYCGKKNTLPFIREEYVINLFNRANRERLAKNYDEALGAYESIVSETPQEAEAHWGAFLCQYGVEYVEDRRTGERLPTIHRMSEEPVLRNIHYVNAINSSTPEMKLLYEKDAILISKVQEKFYKVTANEKPFDVFISYKETEGNGNPTRTTDSIYAQEIYDGLKREGYNVFFSRITLAEKAGDYYEPIIFSALNSSRVMLLIGTSVEHIMSTWVRNEWKRYLFIMKNQNQGHKLIVAYKDFDVFDLPDELNEIGINSVDLSENGSIGELIRNLTKILGPKSNSHYDIEKLYDRVMIDIECGDFEEADRIADQILSIDESYPKAYRAKVMCATKVKRETELETMNKKNWSSEVRAAWDKYVAFVNNANNVKA